MKRLAALLLPLWFAGTATAGELCDAECLVTIEFAEAGYIEAHEALTFTFGDGGLVDTLAAVIAKADGETLVQNAGERLDFGAGGRLELGNGGNLEFTHIEISNASLLSIQATGSPDEVTIAAGSTLEISNTNSLVHSRFVIDGLVALNGSDAVLGLGGSGCESGCQVAGATFGNLSVGGISPPLVLQPGILNQPANLGAVQFHVGELTVVQSDKQGDDEKVESESSSSASDVVSMVLELPAFALGGLALRRDRGRG